MFDATVAACLPSYYPMAATGRTQNVNGTCTTRQASSKADATNAVAHVHSYGPRTHLIKQQRVVQTEARVP